MRWVFDALFDAAGSSLDAHLDLVPAVTLARHAWRAGGCLDLYADVDRSAEAIGRFAGARDARGYREFCLRSARAYGVLRDTFIAAQRPSPPTLVRRIGWRRLQALWEAAPWETLWSALGTHFQDPRLRQLFGRYATYCGSSPLASPATLMLVAHVEQDGVWLVRGGMYRLAQALEALAARQGARLRYRRAAAAIEVDASGACGVRLDDGERLAADAVVFNGDPAALAAGLLGAAAARAQGVRPRAERSLSAVTWCLHARTGGFELSHHNVFFADDYPAEFEAIFRQRRIPVTPTVYVCAQDRGEAPADTAAGAPERLLLLVNAPPDGDRARMDSAAVAAVAARAHGLLQACGLRIEHAAAVVTTPGDFEDLFPGTGGALYGGASHGALASFRRPAAASRIPGLYLAGGATHPGPGLPMAAMSGRLAASRLLEDWARRGGGARRRR